jgi:hypothetical protein
VSVPTGFAPTQELGKALFATGIEGFRSICAKISHHKTLTVFTDDLRPDSSLVFSSSTGVVHKSRDLI